MKNFSFSQFSSPVAVLFLSALILLVFSGCEKKTEDIKKSVEVSSTPAPTVVVSAPTPLVVPTPKVTEIIEVPVSTLEVPVAIGNDFTGKAIKMTTSEGDIFIKFYADKAPKTVENFMTHAANKYYDGVIFHRVIPGFMIQGGDPEGTGMGGESIWGEAFDDEFDPTLRNVKGTISMANSGYGTNGSQFFINVADNTFLDGYDAEGVLKDCPNQQVSCHAVFGEVYKGMDVVEKIALLKTKPGNMPVEEISMRLEVIDYEEIK